MTNRIKKIKQTTANFAFPVQNLMLKVKKMRGTDFNKSKFFCIGLIFFTLLNFACANPKLKSKKDIQNIAPENNMSAFETDLQTMRTANFNYIFAFRRKDGAAFDAEDKKYLRANTPAGTNRFVSTDENRAFIAGSSYKFPPENIKALQNRFLVEDYSKAEIQEANANAGANN
jgi:hypothetical protein